MVDKNVHHRRCLRSCLLARRRGVRPLMRRETACCPGLYSILVYPGARQILHNSSSTTLSIKQNLAASLPPLPAGFSSSSWLTGKTLLHVSHLCACCCAHSGEAKRYFVAIMQLAVHNCNIPKGRNPNKAALLLPFRCDKMIDPRTLPNRTQSVNGLL